MFPDQLHILLVDDDEDDYILTADLLQDIDTQRYVVDWCQNPHLALARIEENAHDVYLVDYRIGQPDGIELIRRAVSGGSRKPFILMTGGGERSVDLQAMEAGATSFLGKEDLTASNLERCLRYAWQQATRMAALDANRQTVVQTQRSNVDELTGQPSRLGLLEQLQEQLDDGRRPCLLYLDIDSLAEINQLHGYSAGNQLLRTIAERLVQLLDDPRPTIGRCGGDEFALLLDPAPPADQVLDIAQRLHRRLAEPLQVSDGSLSLSCSVGIAFADQHSAEELLQDAEAATFRAKAGGRGSTQIHDPDHNQPLVSNRRLLRDLRQAIADQRMEIHLQPIIALSKDAPSGFEALLRWPHSERGLLCADRFLPLADTDNLSLDIGLWAIPAACQAFAKLALPAPQYLSINIAAHELSDPGLGSRIEQAASSAGLPLSRLQLECSEAALLQQASAARDRLHEFAELGIAVVVDEFGADGACLQLLGRHRLRGIKLSRHLVKALPANLNAARLLGGILAAADAMALLVTAVGVENREQLAQMRDLGCSEAQGFHYCQPLPPAALAPIISAWDD